MFKPKRIALVATDFPELEKFCPNWFGMKKGLERLGIPYKFISCRPELDVNSIVEFNPDLIIYGLKDMVTRSDWRKEIRQRLPNAVIVIWYGDLRNEDTMQINSDCSEVNALFISNDAQEQYYRKKWKVPKVHFLPLGCEPIEKPLVNEKYNFPFVFIGGEISGGPFMKRASLIGKFKIEAGLTIINSYDAPTRARIFQAMPEIYSSADICLDISHFTDIQGYTSIRYWEIPAFYGFALTKRWPGCEEFYPEDSRVYFDSFFEGVEKKEYYLKHPTERRKIAEKAHKLSFSHTYDRRFEQMFNLL